jgi:hypothetical protein
MTYKLPKPAYKILVIEVPVLNTRQNSPRNLRRYLKSFYAGPFNPNSFDLSLLLGHPIYSVSFSSGYHDKNDGPLLVRRKLPFAHWPLREILVIGAESSGPTHLFNIGTIEAMDRSAGQAQINLS